ncbi:Ig-like domain-containing protein [Nocardioides sp. SOB77]|uniref:Ig-like domain-containing protein n=1 Tax=Nocardioides oceani TaxID=3058369 RepID=A0ABT8FCK8_9ACTN|nr:Ig-like domain-containing protein [Nocardioides oceani]MDN4172408.1 Ig-like domain-containing protein [Nocardioides oceani]
MNSSGIKRGLAVSAISALAVAGIPALASPASAETGDVIQVQSVGPARNGGTEGALVVLNVRNVTPANLKVIGTDLTNSPNNANQSVQLVAAGPVVTSGTANDTTPNDGLDQITVRVRVTTPAAGSTANFAIFEDDAEANPDTDTDGGGPDTDTDGPAQPNGNGTVEVDEARAPVAVQTSGPVASVDITPANQTAPQGTASSAYTVTIRDNAGRLTQLSGAEDIELNAPGAVTINGGDITADEIRSGSATFTAQSGTPGLYTIEAIADDAPNNGSDTATLDVVGGATFTNANELDVVTGADSWNGFGDQGAGDITNDAPADDISVRVDQTSIRLDFRSPANAGGTVVLTVTGNGVTFGGKNSTTVSTVLDANGVGSVTITPDAGTIQDTDSIDVVGSGLDLDFNFDRAEITSVESAADTYVSAIDGNVTIPVTVLDQFGLPVAGAQVDARRTGPSNIDAQPQARKTTDANGQATFTFTDVNAVPNGQDSVLFQVFPDQFSNAVVDTDTATIRYTTDGVGRDFTISLDNTNTGGSAYNPASVTTIPLTDTNANTAAEFIDVAIAGGETGAPVTVSVDNGALILKNGETRLAQGSATETGVIGTDTFDIIGTKSGLVTLTVTSAGRTKTAQFTVSPQNDQSQARNVSVSGPAEAEADDEQVTFTAVVTDAFGNPIQGFFAGNLNVQVSGPGELQDTDAVSNAQGQIKLNVRLDDDAVGPVTIRVQGVPGFGFQFGAQANRINAGDTTDTGPGLSASSNVAEATVNVKEDVPDETDPVDINAVASGSNRASDGYDRVRVDVTPVDAAAGAAVELWKINKEGKERRVKTKALNDRGFVTWLRVDNNGNRNSRYFAVVRPTETSNEGTSNTVRIR